MYYLQTKELNCVNAYQYKTLLGVYKKLKTINKLQEFSIYKNTVGFHSTAQKEFLIMHKGSDFWKNNGIQSGLLYGFVPVTEAEAVEKIRSIKVDFDKETRSQEVNNV